ncbi:MAG: phosphotriesterase family protein, partial [Anaerolineae bacterium]
MSVKLCTRRKFIQGALASLTGVLLMNCQAGKQEAVIHTVLGPIAPAAMGPTLPHEHIMCDFIGADKVSPSRYKADEIVTRMEPYLRELLPQGVKTFVDCTPDYLARDVEVLRRLAERTGVQIVTNTGWYKEPYLPARAFTLSSEQIAAEWSAEFKNGIGTSGIKPGFIKIAVFPGKLADI